MAKHLLEDMVKIKKVQKLDVKIKKFPKEKAVEAMEIVETIHNKNRPRYMLWLVALISIVFCFFAVSFLFSKAEVVVNPKTKDVVLNENLSAIKDSNTDSLPFDLVVIGGEESTTVKTGGEKNVSIKATGTVVIFNTFSSSPQKLDIDTRLEGSNGKIYKTLTKTVVPGISKDGTPGKVEVGIYGAVAGQEYNSSTPLDFTLFGFKGTSKYSKFIGRSKPGTEITGGYVGKIPAISDTEKATAISGLKTALQAKLLQKSINQIPDGFILFKDAIFLSTNDSNVSFTKNATDNSTVFTLKGTLYGILFNEQKLTQKIAMDNIEKYDGSEVYIPNIKDLVFSLSNKNTIAFDSVKNINFNLSGPAKIVWKLDTEKFMNDLLGNAKKDFNQILSQYVNIESATLTISPVWKMSIPDKSKDIKIIVNYPPTPLI